MIPLTKRSVFSTLQRLLRIPIIFSILFFLGTPSLRCQISGASPTVTVTQSPSITPTPTSRGEVSGYGFWRTVFDFLSGDKTSFEQDSHKYLYFAAACAIIGLIVVIFDFIFTKVRGKSLLNLAYVRIGTTIFVVVLWGMGAGIGGFLAAITDIVHMNIKGCVFIGVGWPFVLPRLISSAREQIEDEQEPNQ